MLQELHFDQGAFRSEQTLASHILLEDHPDPSGCRDSPGLEILFERLQILIVKPNVALP
jgi:hypothetical protein